ncbi:MAG: DUF305 domain-containing protein [Mycobacteriaceae bacterium]|nr:DUF305 domain-containing protein [Mycobacteriaceae bacterium]
MPTLRLAAAAAAAAAAAVAALLTACGGTSTNDNAGHTTTTAEPSEVATHNADDVTFAQNMIPHHQQAVDMAGLAITNTTNADVIALANQITTTQLPEIQAFKAWLVQWGVQDSAAHGAMTGMVDQATIDQLKSLRGTDFDKLWLRSMMAHHQGAIIMAQQEIAHGQNQDVVSTAKTIISGQQAEIDKMRQLLGG